MYNAFAAEMLRIDQDILRRKVEAAARFAGIDEAPVSVRGRRWWPRPRRSVIRLAFAPLAVADNSRPCVDC